MSCGEATRSSRRSTSELPDFAADLRLPRDLERDRADDPAEREPPDRADREPGERVERPERRQEPEAVADHSGEEPGDDLRHRNADDGSDEPHERRIARVLPGRAGGAARSGRRARPRRRARRARTPF